MTPCIDSHGFKPTWSDEFPLLEIMQPVHTF